MTELEHILARSRAADEFKAAVRSFCEHGAAEHIRVDGQLPAVKIRRVLAQMLEAEPHLPVERVSVRGRSGCSDFTGQLFVSAAGTMHVFDFVWDCRWRAEQEGWTDYFGFPDQARAAHEFDWRCFQQWHAVRVPAAGSFRIEEVS